nr:3-hydroxyacyl-CoA dehydrogenase family protein [Fodinicola acaciae]
MRIAVLGLGTMGRGIAGVVAAAGEDVRAYDPNVDAAPAGVRLSSSLAEAVDEAELVFEAVTEDVDAKRAILGQLTGEAIVATNTSSLPLEPLSEVVPDPERFLAAHFFNPADLVPGVEVAAGPRTSAETLERTFAFLRHLGKEPIQVKAVPGFIANRLQLVLFLEALACVEEGLAEPEEIDAVVRKTFGFRLGAFGPLAIADMAGLDVYAAILDSLRSAYGERFALPEKLRDLIAEGRLGTKSGAGLRRYPEEELRAMLSRRDETYRRLLAASE